MYVCLHIYSINKSILTSFKQIVKQSTIVESLQKARNTLHVHTHTHIKLEKYEQKKRKKKPKN